MKDAPPCWPKPSVPELWFAYRTNPSISFWHADRLSATMAQMPFIVAFAYTLDETNHMADILLPDATDLESTQVIPIGGTKFIEQFWEHKGIVVRQAAVEPQGEARDFTAIATELVQRLGLLERYNAAINRGMFGGPHKTEKWDFSLAVDQAHDVDTIWDAICKASTAELTDGEDIKDLAWLKEHGLFVVPFKRTDWYLYPSFVAQGLRFELPYQERLMRTGEELRRRLHEHGVHWWDDQLSEYQPLPAWHDVPSRWTRAVESMGGRSRGLSVVGDHHQDHDLFGRQQLRHSADVRGRQESARPRQRHHQREHRRNAWASRREIGWRSGPRSAPPPATRPSCRGAGRTRSSSPASSITGRRRSPRTLRSRR